MPTNRPRWSERRSLRLTATITTALGLALTALQASGVSDSPDGSLAFPIAAAAGVAALIHLRPTNRKTTRND